MFYKGSRYELVDVETIADDKGRERRYIKTRFIPRLQENAPTTTYAVRQGERLDHVAHRAYRDPGRFWRICDANCALWPEDLIAEVGHRIVIPLAED